MNILERRCIELSYKHKLSHVSSVLNTVNVLDVVYQRRASDDPVVLGNSHAALALYVILESNDLADAEELLHTHGVHASRDMRNGIWVSGGSLGQAETIAVGMALADPSKTVHLVTSDGACAEGAIWEAFSLASYRRIENFNVTVVANGLGAYREVDVEQLRQRLYAFLPREQVSVYEPVLPSFSWIQGLPGHYMTINDSQYEEAMRDN